jgi:hypothetical protein
MSNNGGQAPSYPDGLGLFRQILGESPLDVLSDPCDADCAPAPSRAVVVSTYVDACLPPLPGSRSSADWAPFDRAVVGVDSCFRTNLLRFPQWLALLQRPPQNPPCDWTLS